MDEKPINMASTSPGAAQGSTRRFPIKPLILLVACSGAFFWAYLKIRDEMKPNADLARLLRSSDSSDRLDAVRRLGVVEPAKIKAAVPLLIEAQADPNEEVRVSSAWSLGSLTLMTLKSDPETTREATLGMAHALSDESSEVRGTAAEVFSQIAGVSKADAFPVESAPVVASLVGLLADPVEKTRVNARKALAMIGSLLTLEPPAALLEGVAHMKLSDSRAKAASALGAFTPKPEVTVKVLTLALKDGEPDVRSNAAGSLGSFDLVSAPALSDLIVLLDDPFVPPPPPAVRMPTATAARKGAGASSAIVEPVATDPAAEAARAIGRIVEAQVAKGEKASPEALAGLSKTLKASRPELRDAARDALKRIGKGASAVIPSLIQELTGSLADPASPFGPTAATTLGDIGPGSAEAPAAMTALVAALDAASPETQSSAVLALSRFGTSAASAIPRLKEVAQANPGLAGSIKITIDRLEGKAPPASPRRKGGGAGRKKAG